MNQDYRKVGLLVVGIVLVAGAAYTYKWTMHNERARVEAYERDRIAAEREAAAFLKCHGERLREARLRDQERRTAQRLEDETGGQRLPRNSKFSEEEFLYNLWRASGKKC
ncbi:MAG: hypothetical protein F9K29_03575 [Hyphomicrobiaceae bacterium]|nr:MAG: hypothetical protein F9K29_03575 [Hyphomicrobiaceae bacterium]